MIFLIIIKDKILLKIHNLQTFNNLKEKSLVRTLKNKQVN